MARWQPLPGTLDPDQRRLIEQLRRLKDRSGLSLVALAERTSYSKSAWQRYLNGVKFPPRRAVEALGRVAGADAPRLLALWSIAERSRLDAARRYEVADHPAPPPPPAPGPPGGHPSHAGPPRRTLPGRLQTRRLIPAAAPALALAALLAAVLYVAGPVDAGHGARILRDTVHSLLGATGPAAPASAAPRPAVRHRAVARVLLPTAGCRAAVCQGRDPYTEGCAPQARTAASTPVAGGELRLRYSDRCGAAWAELRIPPGAAGPRASARRTGVLLVADRDGVLLASPADRGHSPMLGTTAPARTRVCVADRSIEACAGDPQTAVPLLPPQGVPTSTRPVGNRRGGPPPRSVLG